MQHPSDKEQMAMMEQFLLPRRLAAAERQRNEALSRETQKDAAISFLQERLQAAEAAVKEKQKEIDALQETLKKGKPKKAANKTESAPAEGRPS